MARGIPCSLSIGQHLRLSIGLWVSHLAIAWVSHGFLMGFLKLSQVFPHFESPCLPSLASLELRRNAKRAWWLSAMRHSTQGHQDAEDGDFLLFFPGWGYGIGPRRQNGRDVARLCTSGRRCARGQRQVRGQLEELQQHEGATVQQPPNACHRNATLSSARRPACGTEDLGSLPFILDCW